MSDAILIALSLLAVAGIAYELGRRMPRERDWREMDEAIAKDAGWHQAHIGLGRDDYPIDYTEAEREAWQRGWDEYHESK